MRRSLCAALAGAALAASAGHAGAGAIVEGTVNLQPPATGPSAKPRYPVNAAYTIGAPDPPAAVVYLDGGGSGRRRPTADGEMAQQHYQFAPGLLAIQRGATVRFPNLDDEYHSVFSYSKAKRFDLGRYRKDEESPEIVFDQPGVVRLFCEIHDHMRGTIVVLDTPYFVKTDLEGRYRLDDVPAGRWMLKVWADDGTSAEEPIELRDGTTLRVDLSPG